MPLSLLDKLELAVKKGHIRSPFTTNDIKDWIKQYNITDDRNQGAPYTDSYINSFASSSVIDGTATKWDKRLVKVSGTNPQQYKFK